MGQQNSNSGPDGSPSPSNVSRWARAKRWLKRMIVSCFALPLLYLFVALLGLIPVNSDFQPTADGIEIIVVSNAVHADVVIPLVTESMDWRKRFPPKLFTGDVSAATHVAIGWGDRGFFLETPTWADFKFSTAANALLLPSTTCMHVAMTRAESVREYGRSVRISAEQYQKMVAFIESSFELDQEGIKLIEGERYGRTDCFFDAKGRYHALNTCNCWVGRAISAAGLKTGWLTPLPHTVAIYFPK